MNTAATKNEALAVAIDAVENLIEAIKLTSDPDEKRELKTQFRKLADLAEIIKSGKPWVTGPAIGSGIPAGSVDGSGRQSTLLVDVSSETRSTWGNSDTATESSDLLLSYDEAVAAPPLHGASSREISVAPRSYVRRLVEPISSRKRTTKEEIILLKASNVNGVKCPPWIQTPLSSEFKATGTELFS